MIATVGEELPMPEKREPRFVHNAGSPALVRIAGRDGLKAKNHGSFMSKLWDLKSLAFQAKTSVRHLGRTLR